MVEELPIEDQIDLWGEDDPEKKSLVSKKVADYLDGLSGKSKKPIKDLTPLAVTNFMDNVRKLWESQPFFYDKTRMFWFWNRENYMWERADETDVMNSIGECLTLTGETVTSFMKGSYLEAFKRIGRKNIPKQPPKNLLQFKNKIVNIETGEETEATPEYFFCNPIPWELGKTEETPTMDCIFAEWVSEYYVKLLYQIIAYCILADYPIHRLFCFIGAGSNGKGSYLKLIRKFIGIHNCSAAELQKLSKSMFEAAKLYKKTAVFIGETDFSELSNTYLLKALTGEDMIGYEFKNKDPFDDYNYAKIIIATNNLPTTSDKTDGFYRRWLIIEFFNQFSEKQDILKEIPEEEYGNLARKSIRILKELLKEREFSMEGTIEERKEKYEEKSNPFDKFWKDIVIEDSESYIYKYEFKNRIDDWCKENRFRALTDSTIKSKLSEKGVFDYKVDADFPSSEGKRKQYWAWRSIRWK